MRDFEVIHGEQEQDGTNIRQLLIIQPVQEQENLVGCFFSGFIKGFTWVFGGFLVFLVVIFVLFGVLA